MVRRDSENCHLSLSAVCDCGISWSYSLTFFDVSAVDSVKQELSRKSVIMPCLFLTLLLG